MPPRVTATTATAITKEFSSRLLKDFFAHSIKSTRQKLQAVPAAQWEKNGQERAIAIFQAAAQRVPAYRDFLLKNKIKSELIATISDFQQVPLVDKENYLRQYPLPALMWDGELVTAQMTAVSSGSSGIPYLWPRGSLMELEITYLFELMLSNLIANGKKTLFVNSQAMGMYIGGPFTLNATLRIAQKGTPLNVVTPGITLEDVLQVTDRLFDCHDQIVIAAYPPFAKDILQVGAQRGIEWSKKPLKFLLFGEGYSESWRDYIVELAGGIDPVASFVNCFGTADAAILAHETPYTIRLRRLAAKKPQWFAKLFGESRLPSIMQYYPTLRYLEMVGGELVLTFGSGGIPLIRYNIHDRGGLVPYSHIDETFDIPADDKTHHFERWQLPLVYVFGKSDFTATLYGLNIYPENIKAALAHPDIIKIISGKFQMSTELRARSRNQYLLIRVELNDHLKPSRQKKKKIQKIVVETLRQQNAEYRKLLESIGKKAMPTIKLYRWGDSRYFTVGTKQRWKK